MFKKEDQSEKWKMCYQPMENGHCVINQCKAQCAKNRKGGLSRCIDTGK
ncbi:unnamed protein product [Brassica rapa subsp. trilocularis]